MPTPPRTPHPLPLRDLAWLALLTLVVKGWLVLALADVFFYGEELEKGTAAKAMLDAIPIAHHRLAYHYYEGGGFVISHLKALAFLLVGENVLAHKLLAMATCLAVLWAGWRLVARHFGARAARLFGLLFVLAPASFQKIALLSLGIHFEALVFVLLVLDGTLRLVVPREGDEGAAAPGHLLRLGIVSGLGIYFSYQLVLVVGYAGLLVALRRRDVLLGRPGAAGVAGLAIGLAPLGVMAALVGRAVFDIHGIDLGDGGWGGQRFLALVRSAYADKGAGELVPLLLYPLAALAAVAATLAAERRERRRRCSLLAGFIGFWFVAYLSSSFVANQAGLYTVWGRFAPVWVLATVLVAVAIDGALGRGGSARRGGWVAAVLLLALGGAGTARTLLAAQPLALASNLETLRRTKGYHYLGYLPKLLGHLEGAGAERLRPLLEFDEPHPQLLWTDLAMVAFPGTRGGIEVDLAVLRELDAEHLLDLARGLGPSLVRRNGRDLAASLAAARDLGEPLAGALAEALGRFGRGYRDWIDPEPIVAGQIAAHLKDPLAAPFLRGVGARVLRTFVVLPGAGPPYLLNPEAARAFLRSQPPAAVAPLLEGFETELERWRLPRR